MRSPVPCCYYRGFCAELYAPPHVPLLQFTQILICPPCCRPAVLTGGMHSNPRVSPVFGGMWSASIDYNLNLSSAAILISVVIKECVPLIILKVFFRILQPFALFLCFFFFCASGFSWRMLFLTFWLAGECYLWHWLAKAARVICCLESFILCVYKLYAASMVSLPVRERSIKWMPYWSHDSNWLFSRPWWHSWKVTPVGVLSACCNCHARVLLWGSLEERVQNWITSVGVLPACYNCCERV